MGKGGNMRRMSVGMNGKDVVIGGRMGKSEGRGTNIGMDEIGEGRLKVTDGTTSGDRFLNEYSNSVTNFRYNRVNSIADGINDNWGECIDDGLGHLGVVNPLLLLDRGVKILGDWLLLLGLIVVVYELVGVEVVDGGIRVHCQPSRGVRLVHLGVELRSLLVPLGLVLHCGDAGVDGRDEISIGG